MAKPRKSKAATRRDGEAASTSLEDAAGERASGSRSTAAALHAWSDMPSALTVEHQHAIDIGAQLFAFKTMIEMSCALFLGQLERPEAVVRLWAETLGNIEAPCDPRLSRMEAAVTGRYEATVVAIFDTMLANIRALVEAGAEGTRQRRRPRR